MDDFEDIEKFYKSAPGMCGQVDCGKPLEVRGYCRKHYYAVKERTGMFGNPRCREEGCVKYSISRGFCGTHYHKARREGRLNVGFGLCFHETCAEPATTSDGYCKSHREVQECSEDWCFNPVKARGLCGAHYEAERRKRDNLR